MQPMRRDLQPEWMDEPDLPPELHRQALVGLARINRFSRSAAILWSGIRTLADAPHRRLRILDIASGAGDVTLALTARCRTAGWNVEAVGCDIRQVAVDVANGRAVETGLPVVFRRLDIFDDSSSNAFGEPFDVVVSSLFLHHQTDERAVELLIRMKQLAARQVLVNDLVRDRLGYWLAWAGTRLLTRSPVVHRDGPQSVAAAFTLDEVRELCRRAGIEGAQLTRHWPRRFLLNWRST